MLSLWRRGLRTPLPDQTTKKLLLKIRDGGTKSDLLKITKGVLELVTIVMIKVPIIKTHNCSMVNLLVTNSQCIFS